ncbi:hypothetical protein PIB30_024438 [Stylosanthes scabra]|uniref:Uncharacterized protein n=1 Tax=Stylosanthes scabra TaxID=79078 RepID=A0ABU6W7P0_9FABA|nr:hypothetical protein [Stylosanthes scabra]
MIHGFIPHWTGNGDAIIRVDCNTGETYDVPESFMTYSIVNDSWSIVGIPQKLRLNSQLLLTYNGKSCLANHPTNVDNYSMMIKSIEEQKDGSLKWKTELEVEGLKIYERPKLFLDDNLISLTNDNEEAEMPLTQILLSRFKESEDYLRHHLQCGVWPTKINIKSIHQLGLGVFPI